MQLVVLLFICEFEGWPLISHCGLKLTWRGSFMHLIKNNKDIFNQRDSNNLILARDFDAAFHVWKIT